VLFALIVLDRSSLQDELRFFRVQSPYTAPGVAPVPQDDVETPALDAALRGMIPLLPRDASCVIAVDAWQRDYFRASYLLMPRRIWPAVDRPTTVPLGTAALGRALAQHRAGCLLAPAGTAAPSGLRLARGGVLALYLAGARSAP
jgi:hypothetical protein